MLVRDIMQTDVACCNATADACAAAETLWDRDCGALPVLGQSGQVIGMVTDRDLCMAALTQGKRLDQIPVRSVMSRGVYTCRVDQEMAVAHYLMREHKIRRLPVLDRKGDLVGILSLNDLARIAEDEASRAEVAKTLAGVGRAREFAEAPA